MVFFCNLIGGTNPFDDLHLILFQFIILKLHTVLRFRVESTPQPATPTSFLYIFSIFGQIISYPFCPLNLK